MRDAGTNRVGYRKLLLMSLLTIHWITENVQCQVTPGWWSGFDATTDWGSGEEPVTNETTTVVTTAASTTFVITDVTTTEIPITDEATTEVTTDEATTEITTDMTTTKVTTAVNCETVCTGSNQGCVGEMCLCDDGFEDVDGYCSRVCPDKCPINSMCTNVENGCECNEGYENMTGTCQDIDECLEQCVGAGRNCINFPGYFSCECADGYYPDGSNCIKESPECSSNCEEHAACINPDAGCECVDGWTGAPTDCQDIDECLTECDDPTLICTNIPGSYYCSCLEGYIPIEGKVSAGCEPETCPEEKLSCAFAASDLCDSPDVVVFPATLFGYSSRSTNSCAQSTTNNGKPYGTRFCSLLGSWEAPRWLSSCNDGLEELSAESIETAEQRVEVSSNLEVLTSNPEELEVDDIETTTAVIENVTAAETIKPVVATSVISTISNVAESPSLADSGQTEELLSQLDDVALKVVLEEDEPYIAVSNNVSMLVTEAKESSSAGIGVALLERPDSTSLGFRADQLQLINQTLSSGNVLNKNMVQGSIYVPGSALKEGSRVAVYVFGNNNLFPASPKQASSLNILSPNDTLVNGIVFSASVEGSIVRNLPDGDRLTFSNPIDNNTSKGKPRCAFWDEDVHAWSTLGCEVDFDQTTNVSIACSCNHLTNFATLLDISGISDPILDIITIVGCSISATALALTLAVFIFVPDMRKGRKFRASFLLMNLSVSLLGLNITLIVSEMKFLSNPENEETTKSSCIAVAALLHLFLLCSWGWMNCEAANLYTAVQKPIYSRNELRTSRVVIFSLLWGYLMPAAFVGITLIANINVYDRFYDGEYKVTCWIVKDMVLYLAVIPTAIMLGFNLVVYGILTYSLCRTREKNWGPTWKSNRKSMTNRLIVNFSLMAVVGVTWTFGILLSAFSFSQTTAKVFAYIFTILNSLQGLFIFLLYILRSKGVRENIKKEVLNMTGFATSQTTRKSTQTRSTTNKKMSTSANPYEEISFPVVRSRSQRIHQEEF